MAEPQFAGDDDLPRTFRREREAREREARERDATHAGPQMGGPGLGAMGHQTRDYGPPPQDYAAGGPDSLYGGAGSGTVTRFEVPFLHLVAFFLKAVLAAIPALILLGVLLFGMGKVLQNVFPAYRLFEIHVRSIDAAGAPAGPGAQVAPLPKASPAGQKK